jgi:hypothetical protein
MFPQQMMMMMMMMEKETGIDIDSYCRNGSRSRQRCMRRSRGIALSILRYACITTGRDKGFYLVLCTRLMLYFRLLGVGSMAASTGSLIGQLLCECGHILLVDATHCDWLLLITSGTWAAANSRLLLVCSAYPCNSNRVCPVWG